MEGLLLTLQTEERSPLRSPWLELQVQIDLVWTDLVWCSLDQSGPVFNCPSVSLQACYWSTWLFPPSPCCCSSWWLQGHVVFRCSVEGGTLQLPAAPSPPAADDAVFIVCVCSAYSVIMTGQTLRRLVNRSWFTAAAGSEPHSARVGLWHQFTCFQPAESGFSIHTQHISVLHVHYNQVNVFILLPITYKLEISCKATLGLIVMMFVPCD